MPSSATPSGRPSRSTPLPPACGFRSARPTSPGSSRTGSSWSRSSPGSTWTVRTSQSRSAEPTAILASRAARGGADAQTALIERMQPLLTGIARRFRGIAPEPDLLQSGTLGLLLALPGYDPERGPFEPYATPFVVGEMAG